MLSILEKVILKEQENQADHDSILRDIYCTRSVGRERFAVNCAIPSVYMTDAEMATPISSTKVSIVEHVQSTYIIGCRVRESSEMGWGSIRWFWFTSWKEWERGFDPMHDC